MNLSAVVLTKNEESNIEKCLENLNFCDEVVVIDDNSVDATTKVARKFGARIYSHALQGDFANQRNFGLKKTKGKWVLYVDADERVSKALAEEIIEAIKSSEFSGYYLNRSDIWLGKKLIGGEWGTTKLLRLARKEAGKWERRVHESWDIKGSTKALKSPLWHYPHKNMKAFVNQVAYYSELHASENLKEGKKASFSKVICYPLAKFFNNFFLRSGYKDGTRGFVFAIMMSFHSFLAWSKQWCQQNKI